jgi:ribosome-associated protein
MKQNPTVREQSLHPEPIPAARERKSDTIATSDEPMDERLITAVQAASDKKAVDIVLLDLRGIASFTDYFLIASGTNTRQVQAIADEIVARLKKQGTRAQRVEGYRTAEWVLVDYGDFIAQIFDSKARLFYDLERLWREAARMTVPLDETKGAEGTFKPDES